MGNKERREGEVVHFNQDFHFGYIPLIVLSLTGDSEKIPSTCYTLKYLFLPPRGFRSKAGLPRGGGVNTLPCEATGGIRPWDFGVLNQMKCLNH